MIDAIALLAGVSNIAYMAINIDADIRTIACHGVVGLGLLALTGG